jgi:hypothetical protein
MSESPIMRIINDKTKDVPHSDPPEGWDGKLPYAVWSGMLDIFGVELEVAVLNDGQRVITEESLARFFGMEVVSATPLD